MAYEEIQVGQTYHYVSPTRAMINGLTEWDTTITQVGIKWRGELWVKGSYPDFDPGALGLYSPEELSPIERNSK